MSTAPATVLPVQLPLTIISGGQTGADLAGLLAAEICGLPTTGWAPRGFRTEKGAQPMLGDRFHLIQHARSDYGGRTEDNIRDSDVTLILSPKAASEGTVKTINECIKQDRAYLLITELTARSEVEMVAFLQLMAPRVINIAGNRETVAPGLTAKARTLLTRVFTAYQAHLKAVDRTPVATI